MTVNVRHTDRVEAVPASRGTGGLRSREAQRRSHVTAILPRGEAIRNFVYTGALDEVTRASELSILSVSPNSHIEELLRERYSDVRELHVAPERRAVRTVRELLDMAHGRWLWSEAAQERWRLREVGASTPALRIKREIKKAACRPFANRRGLEVLSRAESLASWWLRTSDHYAQLFRELKPTLVFNASHVHSWVAHAPIHAAKWLGIPTATFIFSWDNLTSQGRITPSYDYYLVWNEAMREQLLEMYGSVRQEQVFVTGTPQFDFLFRPEFAWTREEFCARVGADPNRPIVLYSTGMANHMPDEPHVVERIADMLGAMGDLGPPQLLVRVYAKDLTGRFEDLKRRRPDILFPEVPWDASWLTPMPEDAYLLTNSLRHSALGINIASTITLELCMLDKPVINVAYQPPGVENAESIDCSRYYAFDHYRPVVESGAVMLARSEAEMPALLRKCLVDPHADRARRQLLIKTMFGTTLDGYSAVRVADRLARLAREGVPARA
jgi:hypothetical protein